MTNVPPVLNEPIGMAVVVVLVVAGLYWQKGLGWHDYRTLHRLKVLAAPVVDAHTQYFILSGKAYRNKSPEFLGTRDNSIREVWARLLEGGGSPHLISSVKYRDLPSGERQYSAAHVVWTHSDGTQTECYGFDNGDGTSDWYVHFEESVANADEHLSEGGTPGDPKGVVKDALGVA